MLEVKVAKLESDVAHIQRDVTDIKMDIRDAKKDLASLNTRHETLSEKVSHLPTKAYLITTLTSGVAFLIGALTLLSRFGWLVAGAQK